MNPRIADHSEPRIFNSTFGNRNSAFTLTELLVVIGLVVLLLTISLPAISFITGSRSVEGAQNQIAAVLARAREEAISRQTDVGVVFYVDPDTDRNVAALCSFPLDWDSTTNYVTTKTATAGDVVSYNGSYYYCILDNSTFVPTNTTYWKLTTLAPYPTYYVDFLPETEIFSLPKGVGVQGVHDPDPLNTGTKSDRYVSNAVIMFDANGRIMSPTQYGISYQSRLGAALGLTTQDIKGTNLRTQIGLVLYDRQAFKTNGGDDSVPQSTSTGGPDSNVIMGFTGTFKSYSTSTQEGLEETWLDKNATPLLINRYTGTLFKTE